ncbi:hypothetical protein AVEN_126155-1 [Araneus ventricosus]|uniref:Gustatory receptor n=1 Tax=Araneus ventricosus TaxID=182803 RepID=A0A4Y2FRH7_ARAVE|nr:hypothetical protein AVEN_126155-1 [Araneus ventricosus]
MLTIVLAAVSTYIIDEAENAADFWALRYKLNDKTYRRVINLIGSYSYFIVYMQFPSIIVLLMCVLIYRYGLHLSYFNDHLKRMEFYLKTEEYIDILKHYDVIEENLHFLKTTLSTPLFIALLHSYFNLYSALSVVLNGKIMIYMFVELGCNVFTGIVLLTLLTIYSSKIPNYMKKIKNTVGFLINKHEQSNLRNEKEIRILKRMEQKEIMYLSACGMIDFKKSFLLTAFGTLLTYGLLIVNLAPKSESLVF